MVKLITTDDVPAVIDKAIEALNLMKSKYTDDIDPSAPYESMSCVGVYLDATHDGALIARQLMYGLLKTSTKQMCCTESYFDAESVLEMRGPDIEILDRMRRYLDDRFHDILMPRYKTRRGR